MQVWGKISNSKIHAWALWPKQWRVFPQGYFFFVFDQTHKCWYSPVKLNQQDSVASRTDIRHIDVTKMSMLSKCAFVISYSGKRDGRFTPMGVIPQVTLRWRHNDHAGVSNHQPHGCLLNRLFRLKSKITSKLRVTGLCADKWPVTRKMFPFHDVIMYPRSFVSRYSSSPNGKWIIVSTTIRYIYYVLIHLDSCSPKMHWHKGPLSQHGLSLIPAWISNHMPSKVWDEITYPFPKRNGCIVDALEWISNCFSHCIMGVITFPCCDWS